MIERTIDLTTPDGVMPTFITHPEEGGPHPVVIFYMDALGIREELRDMCRRIGTVGYYVMLPNLFYRGGGLSFDPSTLPDYHDPKMNELNAQATNQGVKADTRALVYAAERDSAADVTAMGAVGTCMGGRHAMFCATEHPQRVKAFASWHGGKMVSDAEDSPHLAIPKIQAEAYFAWSPGDKTAPAEHMAMYQKALRANGVTHRVELHTGALHGYTFPTRYCYNKDAAERTWERFFDLLRRNLKRREK